MNKELVFITQHKYFNSGDKSGLMNNFTMGGIGHLGGAMLCSQAEQEGFNIRVANLTDLQKSPIKKIELTKHINEEEKVLTCISSMDINSDFAHNLALELPKQRTIMGGVGPTYTPELYNGDYSLAIGRMEGKKFKKILDDFKENGSIQKIYIGSEKPNFSSNIEDYPELNPTFSALLHPEWINMTFQTIETSQGCHYSCDFCNTGTENKIIKIKPLNIVESQLKLLSENLGNRPRVILVVDQNLMSPLKLEGGEDYLLNLMDLFKKYNFYWAGEGTIGDIVKQENHRLLKKISERCVSFLVGAENLLGDVKGSTGKNWLNRNFEETAKILTKHKIPIMWSIIGGLDDQDCDYYKKVVQVVNKLGLSTVIHKAVARPGTPFYEKVKNDGRITSIKSNDRNMKYYSAHKPKLMTEEEMLGGHTFAHVEIFRLSEIAKRFWKNTMSNGLLFAAESAIPDINGFATAKKLKQKYQKEFQQFKEKIK